MTQQSIWVDRDNNGKIKSSYSAKQRENQERLAYDDPEFQKFVNISYAETLNEAKVKKGNELKAEGARVWASYRDSSISLTQTQINAYKSKLKADWTNIIKPAIQGLTTIEDVKNYTVTWSTP